MTLAISLTPHSTPQPRLPTHSPHSLSVQLYDPAGSGAVDGEVLRRFLLQFGLTDITKGDIATLVDLSDRDKDGKIGLSDFRRIVAQSKS
jgi:Ca2+-binding EF-hand superfamily protein